MWKDKKVTVNIEISGDVTDSEITGINITNTEGQFKQFGINDLFTFLFKEYLGLPSFQEVKTDLVVHLAKQKGLIKEYRTVREFWYDVGFPYQHEKVLAQGTVVKLHNTQLIEFVNRDPGHIYKVHYDDWWLKDQGSLLTSSFTWVNLRQFRHRTVSLVGFGDVRFSETINGLHLLNAVSSGTEQWARLIESPKDVPSSEQLISKYQSSVRDHSTWDPITKKWSEPILDVLEPLALAKNLYEFLQFLDVSSYHLDQLSLGGFPVLVTNEVFDQIVNSMQSFGAVALKSLTGVLLETSKLLPFSYKNNLPRWCLFVGSRKHLQGIANPEPIVCSAWTATVDDSLHEGPDVKYLHWMFKVGVKDWRSQIERAVETIEVVRSKVDATALFEFDEEHNWFDPHTPFTPRTMRELFQKVKQQQHKGLQLFLEQPKEESKQDE